MSSSFALLHELSLLQLVINVCLFAINLLIERHHCGRLLLQAQTGLELVLVLVHRVWNVVSDNPDGLRYLKYVCLKAMTIKFSSLTNHGSIDSLVQRVVEQGRPGVDLEQVNPAVEVDEDVVAQHFVSIVGRRLGQLSKVLPH